MKKRFPSCERHHASSGFTVLETLLVLTVTVILAVLLYAAVSISRQSVRKAASLVTMRNIAVSLIHYTGDHQLLPGPLHNGQSIRYTGTAYNLTTFLWPYLGIAVQPQSGEILPQYVPDHWAAWYKSKGLDKVTIYALTPRAKPSGGGEEMNLWGYPTSGEKGDPIREKGRYRTPWPTLVSSVPLGSTVIMTDAAQNKGNETDRPARGELQNYRTRLFLDWHVDTIPHK